MRPAILRAVRRHGPQRLLPPSAAQEAAGSTILSTVPHRPRWAGGVMIRGFAHDGLNGNPLNEDEESEELPRVNGEMSPFERLLQHSQQYRDDSELDEGWEREDRDYRRKAEPDVEVDDHVHDDNVWDGHEDEQGQQQEEDEEPRAQRSQGKIRGCDLEDVLDAREEDHAEFVAQIRRPRHPRHQPRAHHGHGRGHRPHATRIPSDVREKMRSKIINAEEVDFEHGLIHLDDRRSMEKLYTQLLQRDYDRDRVCQNCGERGHVSANCMLPTICSNCGDIGHRRHECPHRSFTPDDLAMTKRSPVPSKGKKDKDPEARRKVELAAIAERHERMKKAFDDELDEYLDHYESINKKRKEKKVAAKSTKSPQADEL